MLFLHEHDLDVAAVVRVELFHDQRRVGRGVTLQFGQLVR